MSDAIVIEGVPPWDGRYPLDVNESSYTVRELGWIKRWAEYYPADLVDGLVKIDAELTATLAVIALVRAGKIDKDEAAKIYERFKDVPFNWKTIRLEFDTAEEVEPVDDPTASSNSSGDSSGHESALNSATLPTLPSVSGATGWASSESPRPG